MDAEIPSELTGSLPRRVRMRGNATLSALLGSTFLIFAVVGGVWAAINVVQQTKQRAALRSGSSVAVGKITRFRKGKHWDTVDYAFGANGASFSGEAELPWELRDDVEKAASLSIRYLSTHPAVNHPAAWDWSLYYWIPLKTDVVHLPEFSKELSWFISALVFGLPGLAILISLHRERRVLAEGVPAPGVVMRCNSGSRGSYSVHYEFQTADGQMTKGRAGGRLQEVGARICVLYLRQNPERNKPYPSPNYFVAE
jgi:hypothetical protein